MAQVSADITESYVSEVKELLESVQKNIILFKTNENDSDTLSQLLRDLHTIKGNSRMLGFSTVEKLAHAIEDIYKSVKDKKIKNTDRLIKLVFAVTEKIHGCVSCISRRGTDKQDIDLYLQYCDKLAAGELIDVDAFIKEINIKNGILLEDDEDDLNENISDIQSIRIKLSRVNEIITDFDTMITREFHLKAQLDELKKLEERLGRQKK